jgi:lauroyl/myristoyl acyltransferase
MIEPFMVFIIFLKPVQFAENFKLRYKDATGRWGFSALRHWESQLSQHILYSILKPFFMARAAANCVFRKSRYSSPRPDFLRVRHPGRVERQQRASDYLNRIIEFFPDRLASEKWIQNLQIEGFDCWQAARREGRGVVLAICHFGPYFLLRDLLRSAGVPAAALIGGKSPKRKPKQSPSARPIGKKAAGQIHLRLLKDRLGPFPEVPLRFYTDELRAMGEFLNAGNTMVIPIDVPTGKQVVVPFCEGWNFQMTAGAIRLAMLHRVPLIPCSVIDQGGWHFLIKLGRPVPQELLSTNDDWLPAAQHLIDEMMPLFRANPEQCRPDLIRCLKPTA